MNYPKIAIRGSKTSDDVIQYLESLGGYNVYGYYTGNLDSHYYYIKNGNIKSDSRRDMPKDYELLEKVLSITDNKYELWEK